MTTRALYQNFFEFRPQFKIFINTNHLPAISDDSLFSSERLRLIPFDRHFDDDEQDKTLKDVFREPLNTSAIFNWLLEGYKNFKSEKLTSPKRALELLSEYRNNCDVIGLFVENCLEKCDENAKIKTKEIHDCYLRWCKREGIRDTVSRIFVSALRKKLPIKRDGNLGNIVMGYKLKESEDAHN